jgi:hypothetical protein
MRGKPKGNEVPNKAEQKWGIGDLGDDNVCCFAHYFDVTFLIRLMRSDYFEGSHWGTPLCSFRSVRSKPIARVLH